MSKIDFKRIAEIALQEAEHLLWEWFPQGTCEGDNFLIGNINGHKGKSLKINLKTGAWKDFAESKAGGNDLISLYAAKENLAQGEAALNIIDQLNIKLPKQKKPITKKEAKNNQAIVPVPRDAASPSLKKGQPHPTKKEFKLSNYWEYQTATGETMFYTVRFENGVKNNQEGKFEKIVIPYSYFGQAGGWKFKATGLKAVPLYGLDILINNPDLPVLMVEGEKTAEAARKIFRKHVSITWHGGINRIGKVDFSPLKNRKVIYWPDADTAGLNSIEGIVQALEMVGAKSLSIVQLPYYLTKGWDLADEKPSGLNLIKLLEEAIPHKWSKITPLHRLSLKELKVRLVYCSEIDQFIDLETGFRFNRNKINSLFRHLDQRKRAIATRLEGTPELKKVICLAYRPNGSRPFLQEDGIEMLNLWRPSNIKPVKGNPAPFVEHLKYLCSSDEEFEHLSDSLAFMVQRPENKLRFAIVLVGKEGTGKSFLGQVMCSLLGGHNTRIASSTEIRSQFNGWIEAKQLILVEEIMTLGRMEVMNNLKDLITQDKVSINIKQVPTYEIENRANFIFSTNHEDALLLTKGDRRYFVVLSDEKPKEQKYYDYLWPWASENPGTILNWFLERNLEGFNPNKRPPMTEGKKRMIEASRDDSEVQIENMIAEKEPPFDRDLLTLQDLIKFKASDVGRRLGLSHPKFCKVLKKVGCYNVGQKKAVVNGKEIRVSLWIIRDVEKYRNWSGHELVKKYLRDSSYPDVFK